MLLFFDIDGTLITDDERRFLPDSAREAIALTRARGNKVFINTGRVFVNIDDFIRDVGFDGYVCGCGSYIVNDGNVLYHHKIPQDVCRDIAFKCRQFRFYSLFEYAHHTAFDSSIDDPFRDRLVEYFSTVSRRLITDIEDPDFVFDKFSAWYYEDSDIEGFKKYISKYFDYIDREGNFCEMPPAGHSKATGIKFLLDYFDEDIHNAYVFGDGNNDLEMMNYVDNSICLGGGSELAKKAATFVTDTVENDGLFKAMKHFDLI